MVRAAVGATFVVDGITYAIITEDATKTVTLGTYDDNKETFTYPKWSVRIVGISKDSPLIQNREITLPIEATDGVHTYKVVSVGRNNNENGRWAREGLDKIIIPDGINDLWELNSFSSCGVKEIVFPASINKIPENSLSGLPNLEKITIVTIDGVSSNYYVQDGILFETKNGVTRIIRCPTKKTFTDGKYTIPDGVTITRYAFNEVNGLKHLVIGKDLTTFYDDLVGLQRYSVAAGNTSFSTIDGMLASYDKTTLVGFPRGYKTDTNDSGDWYIDTKKEDGKTINVKSLTVPSRITTIANNCFRTVGSGALLAIDFNQVQTIEGGGFYNCSGATTIRIPASLTDIKDNGISAVHSLQEFIVDNDNPYYIAADGMLCLKGSDGKAEKIMSVPVKKPFPDDVCTIPTTVKTIDSKAFEGINKIKKLVVTESLTELSTFSSKPLLEEVDFSRATSLTKLGDYVFSNDTCLTRIVFPPSLTNTGSYTFQGCKNLVEIVVPNGSKLTCIGTGMAKNCKKFTTLTFAGSCDYLETIYGNPFEDTKLEEIYIPGSVKTISANAFYNLATLKRVTFAENPTAASLDIQALAFSGTNITKISLPSNVTAIGAEAFRNCAVLKTVHFTRATTNVHREAFMQCPKLTWFDVDSENPVYSSVDGYLLSKDKKVLKLFPPGKANSTFTLLPPSLTAIGDNAFYFCENLKNVTIPNKVTSLGKRAFGGCTNLKTITFLCDAIIPGTNINRTQNEATFDTPDNGSIYDATKTIDINVRKELLSQYEGDTFYTGFFKSISPSYEDASGNEYIAVSSSDVDLLHIGTTAREYHTYTIPAETSDGKTVSLIGDFAFQTNAGDRESSIKEVIVTDAVKYIGAKAFMTNTTANTSTVDNVFILCNAMEESDLLSTVRFELNGSETANYDEFTSSQKIYVKKSQCANYKANWEKFKNQIDYKIPDLSVSSKYGTFSREFDTYIGVDGGDNKTTVRAYYGGEIKDGNGDWGAETERHIRFTSINDGDAATIPANTGVLLKVQGDASVTDADFYYSIAETQTNTTYTPSVGGMQAIVGKPISEKESDGGVYGMSKATGQFMNVPSKQKFSMPIHRSYLQLEAPQNSQAKALVLHFDEDGIVTTINAAETDLDFAPKAYYDLNGRRVDNPTKGVYVVNGKKVVF